jgi:hypothetical protein
MSVEERSQREFEERVLLHFDNPNPPDDLVLAIGWRSMIEQKIRQSRAVRKLLDSILKHLEKEV